MRMTLASLFCGLIFGFGLMISGLTQPTKILSFLDIFGAWDLSVAVVMAAALLVTGLGFALARRRPAPVFAPRSLWPTKTEVDRPLVIGAVLFGLGWGLVGLCPGPALVNLATFSPRVIIFVVAMGLGMVLQDLSRKRLPSPEKIEDTAPARGGH